MSSREEVNFLYCSCSSNAEKYVCTCGRLQMFHKQKRRLFKCRRLLCCLAILRRNKTMFSNINGRRGFLWLIFLVLRALFRQAWTRLNGVK